MCDYPTTSIDRGCTLRPHQTLKNKGLTSFELEKIEAALTDAFDIRFAFTKWSLGEGFCMDGLGLSKQQLDNQCFFGNK